MVSSELAEAQSSVLKLDEVLSTSIIGGGTLKVLRREFVIRPGRFWNDVKYPCVDWADPEIRDTPGT